MQGIYEPNNSFNFNNLNFLTPTVISGGNYFIKFRINNLPLYIQPPKCKTKQSIIKTGKRMHCDLMFNNENEEFIKWMEDLETFCQKKIFENRSKWFETELDEEDIENSFTSPLKIYKSGKFYICRTFVPTIMGVCSLKIYNENEQEVSLESIQENSNVMTILEIQGIKCSAKNFQIDIEVKQMMVLQPVDLFERCIFRPLNNSNGNPADNLEQSPPSGAVSNLQQYKHKSVEPGDKEEEHYDNLDQEKTFSKEDETEFIHDSVVEPITEADTEMNTELETIKNPEKNEQIEEPTKETKTQKEVFLEKPQTLINQEDGIMEVDFNLENLPEETVQIKKRNHIYYELYKEAKKKAKTARDLALSSYLEAKRIKNTYLLDENETDESDLDENFKNMDNLEGLDYLRDSNN